MQNDDVSHLLLLNRRNTGVESTLFAGELEKFKPYQQRLASTVHHEQLTLQEVTTLWRALKDHASRGPGARKWEERERRKKDTVKRFSRARDGYMEVRDGLALVTLIYHLCLSTHTYIGKGYNFTTSLLSSRLLSDETRSHSSLVVLQSANLSQDRPKPENASHSRLKLPRLLLLRSPGLLRRRLTHLHQV